MVKLCKGYADAVKSLWEGLCDVTVRENITNPDTGRTEAEERILCSGVPCRISFNSVQTVNPADGATEIRQTVTLFIGTDTEIPPGSKITVTQNGVTAVYKRSGKSAVHSNHQEIPLELYGGYA